MTSIKNLTIKNTTIGRPKKYFTDEERKQARREVAAKCKTRPVYREMLKIYNKNYYEKHKEQRKENYKKNSVKVTCEVCNRDLLQRNFKRHLETDRHKNNIV